MGLDNIPHKYPCKAQGTAVLEPRTNKETGEALLDDDGQPWMTINCIETQNAGGCPYQNALSKSGITEGRVYGIFGTDCWYRGKYGNFLLEDAGLYDETEGLSFYGALGDNAYKPAHECYILADAISDFLDNEPDWKASEGDSNATDLKYAEWYLRWAADECDGLDCWY